MIGFFFLRTRNPLCKSTENLLLFLNRYASGAGKSITVWEPHRKSSKRYEVKGDKTKTKLEHVKQSFQVLKEEICAWKEEHLERLRCDPIISFQHGDYETIWKFNSKSTIDKWIVTTDKHHRIGKSEASLELSSNNNALFYGTLNTDKPTDGIHTNSGFANMKSVRATVSV